MNYSFEEIGRGVEPCLIGSTHTKNPTCKVIQSYLDASGILYSCDNLRYRVHFNPAAFDDVCYMLDTYMTDGKLQTYHGSNRIGGYREMWQWVHPSTAQDRKQEEETSLVIGLGHVEGTGRINAGVGYLEFNPHKIAEAGYKMVQFLLGRDIALELVRYDLAVDVPIKRDYVRFRKDGRKYACEISDSMTEYLGQRNKPGRCKLYDKAAERGYKGELTRVELTCDASWSVVNVIDMFPCVYDYNQVSDGVLRGVTKAFVVTLRELAENGDTLEPWLRLVDPKTRAKIRKAFSERGHVVYSITEVTKLVHEIKDYAC